MKAMSHTPDPRANGISTNAYCALLPKRRGSHEAKGLVLLLPENGLTVVPFQMETSGWTVVVVDGDDTYQRGGHNLWVGDASIETAIEVTIGEHFVYTREEADALPENESIFTPGGIVFRKRIGYYRDGETTWSRDMHDPITTDMLSNEAHFPARVLGTTYPKGI
jgi:hypothetical protein